MHTVRYVILAKLALRNYFVMFAVIHQILRCYFVFVKIKKKRPEIKADEHRTLLSVSQQLLKWERVKVYR